LEKTSIKPIYKAVRAKYTIAKGAKEIRQKLKEGALYQKDPRTITVKWYKHLIEMHKLIKDVEINNKIL